MPAKTHHALLTALLVLATTVLAACGPDPSEVDRSPVAGMTGENPTPGVIEGEAIEGRQPNHGRITLTGELSADGAAAVECAPVAGAAGEHGDAGHGDAGHGDAGHAAMDDAAMDDAEMDQGGMDHAETAEGDAGHGGGEEGGMAHHGTEEGLRIAFAPNDLPGTRLTVRVAEYHGDGTYDAALTLETQGDDGAYRVSHGTGSATLEAGTLLATDAATHWVAGTVSGSFEGEAGSGEVDGSLTRCFYFE